MVGRLKTSSRKFPVLTMYYPTRTSVSSTTTFATTRTIMAKQHTKTHSLKIRTVRSTRISQVSRNKIEATASIKVTLKPLSVIKTGVSTLFTAILVTRSQTVRVLVDSTKMPNRDTQLSMNK